MYDVYTAKKSRRVKTSEIGGDSVVCELKLSTWSVERDVVSYLCFVLCALGYRRSWSEE
jgi:hypothetical protein